MTIKEKRRFIYLLKRNQTLKRRIEDLEMKISAKKDILTVDEVKEIYGISRSTLGRYRKKGLKVGQPERNGNIYVKVSELEKFLKINS